MSYSQLGCVEPFPEVEIENCVPVEASNDVYALLESRWHTREIQVCWEDATFLDTDEADRALVRKAVYESWEQDVFQVAVVPPKYQFRFVGWTRCSEGNDDGIRIKISDEQPHVTGLGNHIAGESNGMVLNFTFNKWSAEVCTLSAFNRTRCVKLMALHEFGHALGLSHEQNRDDTPESCTEPEQGSDGDTPLGEWDTFSVMNYCNPDWVNGGILSSNDIYWTRAIYYPEWERGGCLPPLSP